VNLTFDCEPKIENQDAPNSIELCWAGPWASLGEQKGILPLHSGCRLFNERNYQDNLKTFNVFITETLAFSSVQSLVLVQ